MQNDVITQSIASIASDYKVSAVAGVLSHSLEKNVIDGKNVIVNRDEVENKVAKFTFAPLQVFGVDVVLSTGEGKPKVTEERTTVFKRVVGRSTSLKVNSARTLLSEIDRSVGIFPFTLRMFEPKVAKLGVVECVQKEMISGYPSTQDKKGSFVAQFKYTVAILSNGKTQILTGLPLDTSVYKSEFSVSSPELVKLLNAEISRKK